MVKMKKNEIIIRDPYILLHEGKYYMYGTRSLTTWSKADGFDCYVSDDLQEWEGPFEVFHKPETFFATEKYWAPECYGYRGAFYILATFASESECTQMYILKSDSPLGPFKVHSKRVTPEGWACIDGTMYIENEVPYLIFSHTFEDIRHGEMCAVQLTDDLTEATGEPFKLFEGTDAKWNRPIPFAKEVCGIEEPAYFTDGPGIIKLKSGKLGMTWSGWGECGYAIGLAISDNGTLRGPWRQQDEPVFPLNGGHGMAFTDKENNRRFVLHYPDTHFKEAPSFRNLIVEDETIRFED